MYQFQSLRRFVTLPLGLIAGLFCLGTLAAKPAQANVTINSVSGIPNLVPAAGTTAGIYVDCSNTTSTPTGTVTVNNSNGTLVSNCPVYYYQNDANGNPELFSEAQFPASNSSVATSSYTLHVSLTGSNGAITTQNFNVTQGQGRSARHQCNHSLSLHAARH